MLRREIEPVVQTATSLLFPPKPNPASRLLASASLASALQRCIDSVSGFTLNTNFSIKLLIIHIKSASLSNGRHLFDEMPNPTLSAYNYMIAAYVKSGLAADSLDLVRRLSSSSNLKPDGFTLSMVLKLSAASTFLNIAKQAHTLIEKSLPELSDDVRLTALIDSYVKNGKLGYARSIHDALPEKSASSTALIVGCMSCGLFGSAEEIFRSMDEKDGVAFNAMIEGYSRTMDTAERSLKIYRDMQRFGFRLMISSFLSVIGACSLILALEFGQQVHVHMIKTNSYSHVKSGSSLIDMYSKCARVEDPRRVFDWMPEKNVFSWTSMIDGYGKNGIPDEALDLFGEMRKRSTVKPNNTTFFSALSACGHAGLLSSGQEVFESMENDYALKPRMEHYACMVDLLGRMGSLHEAYEFIKQIPDEPNSDVWPALLGASRLHGDAEMANVAAKEIFELNRYERPGAYVTLSNTFAEVGKWEGVTEVRELMKERGVSKTTGYSWGTGKCI